MLTSGTSRLARPLVLGALVAAAAVAPAASASVQPAPAPATIAFRAATAGEGQSTRTTTGTFTMTGPITDAGTVRTSYRFSNGRIHGTAVLIGARGIFTLSLRGASGVTVAGHQSAAGGWRVCGGTDAYRHLHGHGQWGADSDFGLGAPGMQAPTMTGALVGPLYRGAMPGYAGLRRAHDAHC